MILYLRVLYIVSSRGEQLVRLKRETLVDSEEYDEEKNIYVVKGYAKAESKWNGENQTS